MLPLTCFSTQADTLCHISLMAYQMVCLDYLNVYGFHTVKILLALGYKHEHEILTQVTSIYLIWHFAQHVFPKIFSIVVVKLSF